MNEKELEIESLLEDIRAFLPQLIEASETLGEFFYSTVNDETWSLFGSYFQGLDDLYKVAQTVNEQLTDELIDVHYKKVFSNFIADMSKIFGDLNRYIDEEQFIQAADCIQYEFGALFQQLKMMLGESNETKRVRFQNNLEYLKSEHRHVYQVIKSKQSNIERFPLSIAMNGYSNIILSVKTVTPPIFIVNTIHRSKLDVGLRPLRNN